MRAKVLGIDPGSITGWAIWGDDGYEASGQLPADSIGLEVFRIVRAQEPVLAAIEKGFIGRGKSQATAITNAETAGMLVGVVQISALGRFPLTIWRPTSTAWRKILGLPQANKKTKDDAVAYARGASGIPLRGPMGGNLAFEHEADAICIAQAAWEHWWETHHGGQRS